MKTVYVAVFHEIDDRKTCDRDDKIEIVRVFSDKKDAEEYKEKNWRMSIIEADMDDTSHN